MKIDYRVIPTLTIDNKRLVKTLQFKKPRYIGDPINALKIFNTKMVDELVILDITRTLKKKEIQYDFLSEFVSEAFMPLAYGGGIKNMDQVKRIFSLGYDKVIFNSILFTFPEIINKTASLYGSQAVIASIDFRKFFISNYKIFSDSGTKHQKVKLEDHLKIIQDNGAGEILLNSINKDGTFTGYDIDLIKKITVLSNMPVIACGGARGEIDFNSAINDANANAVAAGSCFVFNKGSRQSVLISYKH